VPAESFLFLLLDDSIAVRASPPDPAYEDVTRIKIVNLSESNFLYVMHTWGADEIRITSTLNTAQTYHQYPGPVIFETGAFQFCWRSDDADGWKRLDSTEWIRRLPGPH